MLELVWEGERPASELAERCALSRPATSQHLKVLRDAGLVAVRNEGNRRLYRARAEQLAALRTFLDHFWGSSLDRLRQEVEQQAPARRGRPPRGRG